MNFNELFADKRMKSKERTLVLCEWLLNNGKKIPELLNYAHDSKDSIKATCIEAIESASKQKPSIVDQRSFDVIAGFLKHKAPRVKWEAAKVIGNTAHLYQGKLNDAIELLLKNTNYDGTVVRWSAAYALGEIIKLPLHQDKKFLNKIRSIMEAEESNSIKKIYASALKKIPK